MIFERNYILINFGAHRQTQPLAVRLLMLFFFFVSVSCIGLSVSCVSYLTVKHWKWESANSVWKGLLSVISPAHQVSSMTLRKRCPVTETKTITLWNIIYFSFIKGQNHRLVDPRLNNNRTDARETDVNLLHFLSSVIHELEINDSIWNRKQL